MTFSTEKHPGVCEQPTAHSKGFVLNHSMLRVKDPAVTLDFYSRIMGMRVLRKLDFPEMKFSLYFLAVSEQAQKAPEDQGERTAWTFSQSGILEFTHNWGHRVGCGFQIPRWQCPAPRLWPHLFFSARFGRCRAMV